MGRGYGLKTTGMDANSEQKYSARTSGGAVLNVRSHDTKPPHFGFALGRLGR
jgi:hypothetical protein